MQGKGRRRYWNLGGAFPSQKTHQRIQRTFLTHNSDHFPFLFKTFSCLFSKSPTTKLTPRAWPTNPLSPLLCLSTHPAPPQSCPQSILPLTCLCRCLDVLTSPSSDSGSSFCFKEPHGQACHSLAALLHPKQTVWRAACGQQNETEEGISG